jgi:putative addiction module CopG family antidote
VAHGAVSTNFQLDPSLGVQDLRMDMNVTLTTQLQEFIKRQMKAGRFENASDAVCEALRLLEQRDRVAAGVRSHFSNLGSLGDSDIMALAFIVMMEAAKSAQEDLRTIMAEVRAINAAKAALRDIMSKVGHDIAENTRQRNGKPSLKFTPRGIGSENGYHRMLVPHPDPESTNGVRLVPTDMHRGSIKNICVLSAIRDELRNKLDSMSETGEMESLRLQMAMERLSKLMSALSNILKKISDTQTSIVANLK